MEVQVTGKNLDLGKALQTHVVERMSEGIHKYFGRSAEASVTFTKERSTIVCEMTTHLASGVFLTASGDGGDAYAAFENALEKMGKRVRRHKRRLKNHHATGKDPLPAENAAYYTLQPLTDEGNQDDTTANGADEAAPTIIAESQTTLRVMTVSEAVLQLDLAESPAIVFKNAAHGRLNVVYRRQDGHIGWVDPAA